MVRNKIYIAKEYHIQPSEIDILPFYEYEYILEEIKLIQKEQEKQQKEQQESFDDMKSNFNMPNFSNMSSNFKMPTLNIPNI